ncbi:MULTISPECIES: DUF2630 family protein [unclassified Streptomyces]|uniref:DUF2630 family protein n=1 Tax=unclassified Streptomyces TaxID=2593676 RepID=UPI002D77F529|nr:DUF2630 family protein [Streptomyces sp.]WSY68332.1 DUF2630 family protein [Streptomyces sp. NBC_00885]WSY75764.1 DUF2630 family protein [Streptomyces sp. NBC_00879]HET6360059.1 DUF2630 family protein [Streptomyces sp.]
MDNDQILGSISELVAEERALRARTSEEHGLDSGQQARLRDLEVQLDQCWDLLRRRRAKAEFGEDPDTARVQPADEVEGYLG